MCSRARCAKTGGEGLIEDIKRAAPVLEAALVRILRGSPPGRVAFCCASIYGERHRKSRVFQQALGYLQQAQQHGTALADVVTPTGIRAPCETAPGRDAFHRVPFSRSKITDAVERVPTKFSGRCLWSAIGWRRRLGARRGGSPDRRVVGGRQPDGTALGRPPTGHL